MVAQSSLVLKIWEFPCVGPVIDEGRDMVRLYGCVCLPRGCIYKSCVCSCVYADFYD